MELVAPALIVLLGGLVIRFASACRRGRVRRQWLLGYRTALTLRDPKAWNIVHRAMAPALYTAGTGALLGGVGGATLILFGATAAAPFALGGAVVWLILWILLSGVPGAAAARNYAGR